MGNSRASEVTPALHDAVVDQFIFDSMRARLYIIVWKSQENKDVLWWQIIVSGIRSSISELQQTQAAVHVILKNEKRKSLSFRIDEFSCEKQLGLGNNSVLTVSLSIDHLTPLRMDCLKYTIQLV